MNIYVVTYYRIHNTAWSFVTKIYRANYEDEARDNANKDWQKNFSDYRMEFKVIPSFDSYNSYEVASFNK